MVNRKSTDREARIAAARKASEPILAELAQVGVRVESLSDLVNKPIDYQVTIPLLLKWLPQVTNIAVRETIIRALTVKWAKPMAAQPLIEEFCKVTDTEEPGLKWAIANALSEVADASVFEDIVELVRDKRHGRAREMLAAALAKTKDPRAVDVLIELLDDEEVAGHAVYALRLLAPPKAQAALERFVDHPKTWVRNEARRALAKIDKKLTRAGRKR